MLVIVLLMKLCSVALSSSGGGSSNELSRSMSSSYSATWRGGEKYSANQNQQGIPSLASFFNVVTYWDKNNASSPCSHTDRKRDLECKKKVTFDRAGYDKSIEDMKKLILSRLNLDHEPSIKMNQKTMRFIDQLENRVLAPLDQDEKSGKQQSAMVKTKYDMKTPQNRIFNVMHEATSLAVDCLGENELESSLCVYFEVRQAFVFIFRPNDVKKPHATLSTLFIFFLLKITLSR